MNSAELRALYEKLYFHEVDARDRIHSRLQIPLTLVVAIIGVSAFLLQNFDYEMRPWTPARTMFAFFFVASTVSLVTAIVWFVKALYNNEYYFLPDAFGGLDRSRVGKPTEITVVKPVDVRLQQPKR